jgi:NAD(P)H-hydrate epimerase
MITTTGIPVVGASRVPVVTASEMAEIDRRAGEDFGITLLQLMEQAGSHLAALIGAQVEGDLGGRRIVVAVGPGNNGGGGLAAARHLANRGAEVRVVLARPVMRMSDAARHQLGTLLAMGTSCCVATWDLADEELGEALERADFVVDAILGYRMSGVPHGEVDRLIGIVARSARPVVSLDLPSGTHPDTGEAPGQAVVATSTLTLALPKPALVQAPGAARSGRLFVADLGIPASLYAGLGIDPGPLFATGRVIELDRAA